MKKTIHHNLIRLLVLTAVMACVMSAGVFAAETGVITGDVVNARKGPGTSYERVEMLAKGKQVTILGEENGWYKIKWNDSTGYVIKEYVATNGGSSAQTANATVTGGSTINVRSGPGTGYSRVTLVAEGKRVAVLDKDGDWYQISVDGKTGYILGDYLNRDGSAAAEAPSSAASVDTSVGNATVTGGSAINVRSGPGTGYARVAVVGAGKRVTLLAKEGDWYKLSFSDTTGYVLGDFLVPDGGVLNTLPVSEATTSASEEPQPVSTTEATAVESVGAGAGESGRSGLITGGTINVRSGPGTSYERVTQVSTGKRVNILSEEGGWYKISFGGTTGYILSDYLYEGDSFPASAVGEQVVALARQYLGVPYVYGGSSPSGFDCSGFTAYLYKQYGYSISHSASGQYAGSVGYKVSKSELQPGDLVYFTSPGAGGRINHVALYMGDGQIIHARYSMGQVYINSLSESYYTKNYVGALRIA